jgi:hypothetical protein
LAWLSSRIFLPHLFVVGFAGCPQRDVLAAAESIARVASRAQIAPVSPERQL